MTFFIIAAVAVLLGFLMLQKRKEKSGNWIQFFAKGKEAGFSMRDMEKLRRLVSDCKIPDPVSIFSSHSQFQVVIRSMINTARLSGEINDQPVQEFLSKLFDYCKKIEMAATENKVRISNSRQISEGQILRILVPGTGVYKSEVIKNLGNNLTISRPINSKQTSAMQWNGLKISVYFWRESDAGYVFDTEVIDEVFSKGISSLKVEHNDSLFRTQKRKSTRIKFCKMAFLYLVRDTDSPHMLEKTAGLRCMLDDISDTGCSFKVKGHASQGLRLKVQFSIDRYPICMPGTVRAVEYKEDNDISLVRMEADALPIGTRNQILCEVYKVLEEDDDELPFRVIEEEADGVVSQKQSENASENFQEVMNA